MTTAAERIERSWDARREQWLELLAQLVDQNSGSDHLAGVDAVRRLLRPRFEALGFAVHEPRSAPSDCPRERASHLVARRAVEGRPKVLLIAHLDTVYPPGDDFARLRRDGDVLAGPGVGDIKGGAVAILASAAALQDAGLGDSVDLTVFMNSDEEVGSHSSRVLLRELASGCDVALGFEPAFHAEGEDVAGFTRVQHVVERKGCGRFVFHLRGVAAHAGGAHHLGVSAIEGLARKVVDVHALADRSRGITTNVGLVTGGRSVNTVAPSATGGIDFRFRTVADGEETAVRLRAILERPEHVNPQVATPVTCDVEPGGGVLWPPLVPDARTRDLSAQVMDATKEWGLAAEGIARGGASDAAHAAAVGIPALCGLGPVSSGIHTDQERTSVRALRVSTLVAATLLPRLRPPA